MAGSIATDSEFHAQRFVQEILKSVERLADFPEIGRIVPERMDARLREIFYGSYRIVYRLKGGAVEILTIVHMKRLRTPDNLGGTY